ncbi:phytanoyl-CoA dioxygenase family protein [Aporhodopirellula aestuarii]|uniref:Phytanoyl-CoA dioxygenase family protein n=1 Tax=Aporhodopirellula aestuarii TaxID=2950107 RepID=A0ABT0U916_9BACT|nr:phytanoyl-CoA dioxygenase family protein [Aporhodopirellula aestuarii]MCM2373307.1 phytanoyl-CoA dioxygenase family protein [Aporhodopirellula aestuarii]
MKLIERYGYRILREVVTEEDCESIGSEIVSILASNKAGRIENRQGGVVGGRNLIEHDSLWKDWIASDRITRMIREHVGANACVVRVLFFDKPPGQGWALSLHRDRTIAVKEHHDPPTPFSKPTLKAGVAHVEATDEVLARMLTLRLHLDPMKADNGAVFVVPRSHIVPSKTIEDPTNDPAAEQYVGEEPQTIFCRAGDVFAMRPLLSHGSHSSDPKTQLQRRVLHLEIAPQDILPEPYQWHTAKKLDFG